MSKKVLQANISMILVIICLIISVIAFISLNEGTAWFSKNKKVDTNGMEIKMEPGTEIDVTITYHQLLGMDNNRYHFNQESIGYIDMPTYSILNDNLGLFLIHIQLDKQHEDLTFKVKANDDSHFMKMDPNNNTSGLQKEGNKLSNIVFISYVTNANVSNSQYNSNDSIMVSAINNKFTFFDSTSSDLVITKENIFFQNQATTDIYIIIGYDEDLISRLYSENIGNENLINTDTTELTPSIKYNIDFEFILSN